MTHNITNQDKSIKNKESITKQIEFIIQSKLSEMGQEDNEKLIQYNK